MATMTMKAAPATIPTPNRWGDNTIVVSEACGWFSIPPDPKAIGGDNTTYGIYTITLNDLTVDTFPQFEPRADKRGLEGIFITEINIKDEYQTLELGGIPVSVGDTISLGEINLGDFYIRTIQPYHIIDRVIYFGDIKYIPSDDGINYNPDAECTLHVMLFPTSDAFIMTFNISGGYSYPKGKITPVKTKDITQTVNYYNDPKLPSWSAVLDPATLIVFNNYMNSIGNFTPYKIEIENPIDPRLKLYGKPIKHKQKIPISSIDLGYLTVDFTGVDTSPVNINYRFGNGFNGAFMAS